MIKMLFAVISLRLLPGTWIAEGKSDVAMASIQGKILKHYLEIHSKLASDKVDGVAEHAAKTHQLASDAKEAVQDKALKEVIAKLQEAAQTLKESKDLAKARDHFKKVSQAMVDWHELSAVNGMEVAYCSMAKGSWLQAKGDLQNPYYGSKMLKCGEWKN